MRILALLILLAASPGLARAGDCPASPDIAAERDPLLDRLAESASPGEARPLADALWLLWRTAPDAEAQALLDRGIARREAYDFEDSERILDDLVTYCPDYAEGYNQRAFTRFLRQNYGDALTDLDRTLALEPRHFGALSGRGLVLMNMGRMILGQTSLKAALEVHPWLNERALLLPDTSIEL